MFRFGIFTRVNLIYDCSKNIIKKYGGQIMSVLSAVAGILIVIALAMTVLRNPNQENKTLITVLLILQVIFIILNLVWK